MHLGAFWRGGRYPCPCRDRTDGVRSLVLFRVQGVEKIGVKHPPHDGGNSKRQDVADHRQHAALLDFAALFLRMILSSDFAAFFLRMMLCGTHACLPTQREFEQHPAAVRAECLGKRPKFPRIRQRTRSNHRRSGRHLRYNHSEAANSAEDKRLAGFHDRKGRRLFLPSEYQGASSPRHSKRLNSPIHARGLICTALARAPSVPTATKKIMLRMFKR